MQPDYDVFGALRRFREGAIDASVDDSPCSEIEVQTEVVYDIDPAGRRVGRTQRGYTGGEPGTANVRRWIYADALNPVAQLDERNRITQAYVYGNYAHTPDYLVAFTYADAESTSPSSTTTYRYVYDIRGSVRLVVNASTGVIAQQLDYGPWGEVLDDSAPGFQPFGYAGGEYDTTTDLVRFGARDYDAEIGRWTAKDPIGFAGGDTHLYAYVGGDPVGLVDVTGNIPGPAIAGGVGCVSNMFFGYLLGKTSADMPVQCLCGIMGGGGAAFGPAGGALGGVGASLLNDWWMGEDELGEWLKNAGLGGVLGAVLAPLALPSGRQVLGEATDAFLGLVVGAIFNVADGYVLVKEQID